MTQLLKLQSDNGPVYIEVGESFSKESVVEEDVSRDWKESVINKLDKTMENIVQGEITNQCKILDGAFKKLKKENLLPKKANVEFGLQFTTEGNVYIAKLTGQSTFKISYEWEFT